MSFFDVLEVVGLTIDRKDRGGGDREFAGRIFRSDSPARVDVIDEDGGIEVANSIDREGGEDADILSCRKAT